MRVFTEESALSGDRLELGLAPALTPEGLQTHPLFFSGFATRPQLLARGLVTLSEITATRYFQYRPVSSRDPILTAQGDRLRAECFSACNGVYARLDLLGHGFDGGEITHGTTNVDLGPELRTALTRVTSEQLLHLNVGHDGLTVSSPDTTAHEHPVQMPDRWVRALGNAAEMHHQLTPAFTVGAAGARAFLASLPSATGKTQSGWLTPTGAGTGRRIGGGVGPQVGGSGLGGGSRVGTGSGAGTGSRMAAGSGSVAPTASGAKIMARPSVGAVSVAGAHRLSAAKRLLTNVTGMTVYGSPDGAAGSSLFEFELPDARLILGLTDETWRGYSGEGALLEDLAGPEILDDADLVSALLAFEAVINITKLSREAKLSEDRIRGALAVLAASGRVGWDAHDGAYFHRELPDDPERVLKDNPRLVAAEKLVAAVVALSPGQWRVPSASAGLSGGSGSGSSSGSGSGSSGSSGSVDDASYRVHYLRDEGLATASCSCAWYLRHLSGRGPCKHVLAVHLHEQQRP